MKVWHYEEEYKLQLGTGGNELLLLLFKSQSLLFKLQYKKLKMI